MRNLSKRSIKAVWIEPNLRSWLSTSSLKRIRSRNSRKSLRTRIMQLLVIHRLKLHFSKGIGKLRSINDCSMIKSRKCTSKEIVFRM
jgi:hypothetical protein